MIYDKVPDKGSQNISGDLGFVLTNDAAPFDVLPTVRASNIIYI